MLWKILMMYSLALLFAVVAAWHGTIVLLGVVVGHMLAMFTMAMMEP